MNYIICWHIRYSIHYTIKVRYTKTRSHHHPNPTMYIGFIRITVFIICKDLVTINTWLASLYRSFICKGWCLQFWHCVIGALNGTPSLWKVKIRYRTKSCGLGKAISGLVSVCIGNDPKLRPHMSAVLAVLEKLQDPKNVENYPNWTFKIFGVSEEIIGEA